MQPTDECHVDTFDEFGLVVHVVLDGGERGGATESEQDGTEGQEETLERRVGVDQRFWNVRRVDGRLDDDHDAGDDCRQQSQQTRPPAKSSRLSMQMKAEIFKKKIQNEKLVDELKMIRGAFHQSRQKGGLVITSGWR